MTPEPRPDAALLRSADPEAFGVFYTRHLDAVTSFVARRVRRPDLTLDLVAETFARALAQRRRFDPSRGPAVAWLLAIARNLLIDAARRGRVSDRARRRLGMEPVLLEDEQLERIVERGALPLADALASLPEAQREAVLLRVVAELPYDELAARIGCSDQVVRQRVSRGLSGLRRYHEEQG